MLCTFRIFDLDGTLTDPVSSRASFEAHYFAGVAQLLHMSLDEVTAFARAHEPSLRPEHDAWVRDGQAVSSAGTDPYLRCTHLMRQLIAQRLGTMSSESDAMLLGIFRQSYAQAELVFRDGIDELTSWLLTRPAAIVTNSDPVVVQKKLQQIPRGHELISRLHGHAHKYAITPGELNWLPESMAVPGLSREVLVRRGRYFQAVQQARGLPEARDMNGVVVIGDNLELDLTLPLMLGAWVVLMVHEYTPQHEQNFVRSHPRGFLAASLHEAVAIANSLGDP